MGQAVPRIPLSVGSKLEQLRAFVFAKCLYTSRTLTHLSAYAYCPVYACIFMFILAMHIVHDRGAEGFAL